MIPLISFLTPPGPCGYLPTESWQLHYEIVAEASSAEYEERLRSGWRRFGRAMFRPRCPQCTACQSLRVDVARFHPDRSMRRNRTANANELQLTIGKPEVSNAKLELYDKFHVYQSETIGWPSHDPKDPEDYYESFVDNPFPTEEWSYYLNGRLVGIGYVDVVSHGLSAIYFFHDPAIRSRGPGTWNVLSVIAEASRRNLPYVYLGYYVTGCRSLEYKGRFQPSEAFDLATETWRPFIRPSHVAKTCSES